MSKKMALLSYQFMFDPSEVWQQAYQFEQTFAAYLKEFDLQAEIIKPLGFGGQDRIIYITKMPPVELPKPKHSNKPAGQQIRDLGKKIK